MGTFACFHDWTHNGSEIIQTLSLNCLSIQIC